MKKSLVFLLAAFLTLMPVNLEGYFIDRDNWLTMQRHRFNRRNEFVEKYGTKLYLQQNISRPNKMKFLYDTNKDGKPDFGLDYNFNGNLWLLDEDSFFLNNNFEKAEGFLRDNGLAVHILKIPGKIPVRRFVYDPDKDNSWNLCLFYSLKGGFRKKEILQDEWILRMISRDKNKDKIFSPDEILWSDP